MNFSSCVCAAWLHIACIKHLLKMEQWHSLEHLSRRAGTGVLTCSKQKGVWQTVVFIAAGDVSQKSSFMKFPFQNKTENARKIVWNLLPGTAL
jgi:hypothetical protein